MSIIKFDEEYFMRKAIAQAEIAAEEGEVPVGAVAVK
ncbi:MAG: nucleoside deaminase, partial [Lentisphaerota bacterium]